MSSFVESIHNLEYKLDLQAERFAFRHPYAAILVMFAVMPIIILAAVAALTTAITFPVGMFLTQF